MARQIIDGKAPDLSIEAAKIVGTLSSARQACNAADPYESAEETWLSSCLPDFEMQGTDTNEPFRKPSRLCISCSLITTFEYERDVAHAIILGVSLDLKSQFPTHF